MHQDVVYAGFSENVMAECSYASNHKYSIVLFCDGEPVLTEGYDNFEGMTNSLKEYHGAKINILL